MKHHRTATDPIDALAVPPGVFGLLLVITVILAVTFALAAQLVQTL
ncbi:MAG: hypothetical protein NVS2B16_21720 [Chloroflexota bacterium]